MLTVQEKVMSIPNFLKELNIVYVLQTIA